MAEKAFSINGRHAASSGSSDGLAIRRILNVSAGEYARDVRFRRAASSNDVTQAVQFQLTGENFGIGFVANGDKNAFTIKNGFLIGNVVQQPDASDAPFPRA